MASLSYYDNLMDILKTNTELHKTAKGISKQMALSAAGTIAGGLVGGTKGAVIGGIAGSVVGYTMSDDYKTMVNVLKNLPDKDRAEVVKRVKELVGAASIEALTRFIDEKEDQRSALLRLLRAFVTV